MASTLRNIKLIVDRVHFKNDGQVIVDDEYFPFGIAEGSLSVEPYPGGGAKVTLTLYANEVVIDPPRQEALSADQELSVQDQGG